MIAYLEPWSGASGDMILGALLDAGLALEELTAALRSLPLPDWRIERQQVRRGAIAATLARVITEEPNPPHRHLAEIVGMIDAARLPGSAATMAQTIFTRLAESEAHVHGTSLEDVHFHEVGAADAILDICGAACGLQLLGITTLYSGPLPLNSGGSVQTAHGILPLPAPATLELLRRAEAPTVPHAAQVELVTPTGAAIVTTLARFERPAMRLQAVGYGAGSRSEPEPNILRLSLGQATGSADAGREETLTMLACNLDDMNPQWYGQVFELLLAGGALDVTCTPTLMKKGRPGQVLQVLCREHDAPLLTDLLLAETTTLGVRRHSVQRTAAARAIVQVQTRYGTVPIKVRLDAAGEVSQALPEYDVCRALARETGASLARVSASAHAAAYPLLGTTITTREIEEQR